MTDRFLLSTEQLLNANDFASTLDLYFKYSQIDGQFDNTGTGQTTVQVKDAWGRTHAWHSAFKVKLKSGADEVMIQDPGVFVLNDSTMPFTVQSSITKTFDASGNPHVILPASYTATQSSGETLSLHPTAKVIRFLDEEAPVLELSPLSDGINTFILAEGGVHYTDVSAEVHPWQ